MSRGYHGRRPAGDATVCRGVPSRRMGAAACRNAALAVLAGSASASAGPWRVQVETGGEIDSNVQRVETGPDLDNHPYTAPLARAGGRIERSGRRGAGGYALALSASTRAS